MTQDYFARNDRLPWREAIEEYILRERIEAAFEAVKDDMTFVMQGYYEGAMPPGWDEVIGDQAMSGTGPLVKKKCWLQQVDVSARAAAAGPGVALEIHNLTKGFATPPIPLNVGGPLRHEHFVAPTHFAALPFDVNDQLAVRLQGAGDAGMRGLNVILYFHKDEVVA